MNNTKLAEKLLDMKEKIDEAKVEKNREEGKSEELFKQLRTEFNCRDLKIAKKAIENMEQEIEKEQRVLDKGVRKLEDNYEW